MPVLRGSFPREPICTVRFWALAIGDGGVVHSERGRQRVSFRALEADMMVVIEADSEDDARALCAETGLQFLTLCDD